MAPQHRNRQGVARSKKRTTEEETNDTPTTKVDISHPTLSTAAAAAAAVDVPKKKNGNRRTSTVPEKISTSRDNSATDTKTRAS